MRLSSILVILLIQGCVDERKKETLDLSYKKLLGKDDDGNGVRDDIDRFIEKTFVGENNIKAAKQYAKYFTQYQLFWNSKEKLLIASSKYSASLSCFDALNENEVYASRRLTVINPKILNTKERVLADARANEKLAGEVRGVKDIELKGCEFKLKNK